MLVRNIYFIYLHCLKWGISSGKLLNNCHLMLMWNISLLLNVCSIDQAKRDGRKYVKNLSNIWGFVLCVPWRLLNFEYHQLVSIGNLLLNISIMRFFSIGVSSLVIIITFLKTFCQYFQRNFKIAFIEFVALLCLHLQNATRTIRNREKCRLHM